MHRLAFVFALGLAGCGTCREVAAHREAFRAEMQTRSSHDAPHVRLEIPQAMIDAWSRDALRRLPTVPFDLPGRGDLGHALGRLAIEPRQMRVAVQRDGHARFDLDFDVKSGDRSLFGMQLGAVAPVRYDITKGTVEIELRADLFETIEPRLDANASNRLTDAILRSAPSALRAALRGTAQRVAREGIALLSRQAYPLLRRQVLTPLGTVARFKVSLPDAPIEALALSTVDGRWRVDAQLSLNARGLAPTPSGGQGMTMAISTEALANLGNWAVQRGHIPPRYTRDGKPSATGEFTPGFAWRSGPRPLKVHLWSADEHDASVCLHVRAGASPQVSLQKGKLAVRFEDGIIEEITGPPLITSALGLLGISTGAFEFTRSIASRSRIQLGSNTVDIAVTAAELNGDALTLELAVPKTPGI
jgi:hypothetical protein